MENKNYENLITHNDVLPNIPQINKKKKQINFISVNNESNSKINDTTKDNQQYLQKLNNIMKDYKYEIIDDNFESNTHREYSSHSKNKKVKKRVISSMSRSHDHNPNEDSLIKIEIKEEEFSNPKLSRMALEQNKNIYESVMRTIRNRSEGLHDQLVKEHKEQTDLLNLNDILKNVKISQLISRKSMFQELKNREKQSKNKKESNMNNQSVTKPRLYYDKETMSCKLIGNYIYNSKNFPEGRDQFSLSVELNDIVLFGGIVSNQSNFLWMLDPSRMEWNKITSVNTPAFSRYGHTGILFQKKLYIFGGRSKLDNFILFGDLDVFNLDTRMWENPIIFTKPSTKRRNHIAKLIGNQILIHGGINENGEYLNDCCLLSLNPLKWININIESEFESPTLAYHDSCLVLPYDQMYNNKLNIYKLPEQNIGKKTNNKIREKGLYVFGGKSSDDGSLKNDLWILKIGVKPLKWNKIITKGAPPSPRYGHTMNFYEDGNFIIIHGGRNDSFMEDFALNDTYLLELDKFDWIRVQIKFDSPNDDIYKRCGHCSIVYCKIT